MKQKIISIVLTAAIILSMLTALCTGVMAAPLELTVGTTYPTASCGEIKDTTDIGLVSFDGSGLVNKTSKTLNGITVTATLSDDKKTVNITYSGTPSGAGITSFTVKYAVGGEEKTYDVSFDVLQKADEVFPPEITSAEPSNLNQTFKKSDDETVFSVSATGNGTVSYRWKIDGTEVATGNKLTLVPEDMSVDVHTVECVVSNTVGSTSKHSTMTWKVVIEKSTAPEITSKESSASIEGTGTVDFKVTAEGSNLKYQWYLVSGTNKQMVVDGTYGNMEYIGATTDKLTVKCTMAPQNASTKFICEVVNGDEISTSTGEYILNITEDPNAKKVQKIEVSSKPSKTEYTVGETFNQSGLKIKITTGKGTEEITEGFVCSPIYLESEGAQTITVSYGGKTTTFTVTVNKAPHEHEWSEWKIEGSGSLERVVRECTAGDDCTAQEILTKDSFIAQYPELAAQLGIKNDDDKADEKVNDNSSDDIKQDEKVDDTSEENKNKSGGSAVLWIIIIIAIILLAGVIFYYVKVYRKPYKKPNSNRK